MSDAYDRVVFRGHTFNKRTVAMIVEVERRLGRAVTIAQGSYHFSTSASAGTHDGGGAVDWYSAGSEDELQRVAREVGFAAFHRRALPGVWSAHVHAIAVDDAEASPLAKLQVAGYRKHRDGLGGWPFGDDPSWHPSPITVFDYDNQGDEDDMQQADWERLSSMLDNKLGPLERAVAAFRKGIQARDVALMAAVEKLPDGTVTREEIRTALQRELAQAAKSDG